LIDYMLAKMTEIVSGMRVFPERMIYNLESTGGLVFSGQLLLDLVEAGAPRDEAYKWVQSNAMAAWEGGATFRDRVATDERITRHLNPEKIAHAFSLHRQLHAVDAIFARVFA
jgi:adenylosuccinate lyase